MKHVNKNRALTALMVLGLFICSAVPTVGERVQISFTAWGVPNRLEVYEKLARAFNEQQDDIEVEFIPQPHGYVDQLKLNILAGIGPDVYLSQEMQTVGFIDEGWFIPLNEYIANDSTFDINSIHQGSLESFTWAGRIGALPVFTFTALLYYNPHLFDRAGVPAPSNMTWEDLVEVAKRLTIRDADGAPIQYGHRVEYAINQYIYYLWQSGGGVIDQSRRRSLLNTPETIEAAQFIQDLAWQYQVIPKPGEVGQFAIEKGNLGMYTMGSWMIGNYANQFNFTDVKATNVPSGRETITTAYPNGLGISAASQHPDQAWEFIKWVVGPEGQKILAAHDMGIPIINDPDVIRSYLFDGPTVEQRAAAVASLAIAQAPPVVPGMQEDILGRYVGPALQAAWRNESPPDPILEEAHRLTQEYLDQLWAGMDQ